MTVKYIQATHSYNKYEVGEVVSVLTYHGKLKGKVTSVETNDFGEYTHRLTIVNREK